MRGPDSNSPKKSLTLQNVNPSTFGKLFVIRVDGKVDAQPLYAEKLEMPNQGVQNLFCSLPPSMTASTPSMRIRRKNSGTFGCCGPVKPRRMIAAAHR
jgi:hypothetical protein